MRCLLEPRLVNDAFGDPGLFVDFQDERRSLLFDLGDITQLAPRKLMRLSHAFVTHTHMDHFSGFDHLLRVVLHDETTFRVRGRFVDHDVPCLAFAIEEKARLKVDKVRLAALGLGTGSWLRELKHAVLSSAPDAHPINVQWRDAGGPHAVTRAVADLRDVILDTVPGRRVGYVTDLRFTEQNVQALSRLLTDVDLLFIESVFLEEDSAQAARKNHLTARQAGEIARRLRAKAVVPFHFSPRYEGRQQELIDEVRAAWSGPEAPGSFGSPPPEKCDFV
jgi:ribonuclease Z